VATIRWASLVAASAGARKNFRSREKKSQTVLAHSFTIRNIAFQPNELVWSQDDWPAAEWTVPSTAPHQVSRRDTKLGGRTVAKKRKAKKKAAKKGAKKKK
jgi:hypothetical protein